MYMVERIHNQREQDVYDGKGDSLGESADPDSIEDVEFIIWLINRLNVPLQTWIPPEKPVVYIQPKFQIYNCSFLGVTYPDI